MVLWDHTHIFTRGSPRVYLCKLYKSTVARVSLSVRTPTHCHAQSCGRGSIQFLASTVLRLIHYLDLFWNWINRSYLITHLRSNNIPITYKHTHTHTSACIYLCSYIYRFASIHTFTHSVARKLSHLDILRRVTATPPFSVQQTHTINTIRFHCNLFHIIKYCRY